MIPEPDRSPIHILHLEDSPVDHELAIYALRKAEVRFTSTRVQTLDEFRQQIATGRVDVVLADYRLPGFTALDAWELLRQRDASPPFVILSGAIGEEAAVEAMRRGINDYLLKDSMGKLAHVLFRAIEISQIRSERRRGERELAASERRLADFAAHLQTSIEQERAAIAREVHDDIGGALSAIRIDLAWIERHGQDPQVLAHVASANDMLQHALGASQRIMMNLRPAILDQGLLPALQWLTHSFADRTGIRTLLQTEPEVLNLPKPIELVAYRTAQEALTNISKHAQCTEVAIDVSATNSVLTLEVSDNGLGIQPENLLAPKAFGIKGLQERAKTVGGWLDVTGQRSQGTSIILTIPLSAAPAT